MRLLNLKSLELLSFDGCSIPPYAILSHTRNSSAGLTEPEVVFTDWDSEEFRNKIKEALASSVDPNQWDERKKGQKLVGFCKKAREFGLEWGWIDTLCIDKRTLAAEISDITRIPERILRDGYQIGEKSLEKDLDGAITPMEKVSDENENGREYCLAERLSWAGRRKTTREEDRAYSLMGLFSVNMPILYGEGFKSAFHRLLVEMFQTTGDYSIFAWVSEIVQPNKPLATLFASDLEAFSLGYGETARKVRTIHNHQRIWDRLPRITPPAKGVPTHAAGIRLQLAMVKFDERIRRAVTKSKKNDLYLAFLPVRDPSCKPRSSSGLAEELAQGLKISDALDTLQSDNTVPACFTLLLKDKSGSQNDFLRLHPSSESTDIVQRYFSLKFPLDICIREVYIPARLPDEPDRQLLFPSITYPWEVALLPNVWDVLSKARFRKLKMIEDIENLTERVELRPDRSLAPCTRAVFNNLISTNIEYSQAEAVVYSGITDLRSLAKVLAKYKASIILDPDEAEYFGCLGFHGILWDPVHQEGIQLLFVVLGQDDSPLTWRISWMDIRYLDSMNDSDFQPTYDDMNLVNELRVWRAMREGRKKRDLPKKFTIPHKRRLVGLGGRLRMVRLEKSGRWVGILTEVGWDDHIGCKITVKMLDI